MSPLYVILVGAVVASVAASPSMVHDRSSAKRHVAIRVKPGEPVKQDPLTPEYYALAIESVLKYNQKHIGGVIKVEAVGVLDVTTQLVAGVLTHLRFYVDSDRDGRYGCDSKVWEREWMKKKEDRKIITVDCVRWYKNTN